MAIEMFESKDMTTVIKIYNCKSSFDLISVNKSAIPISLNAEFLATITLNKTM
jgi:hypothetical protein